VIVFDGDSVVALTDFGVPEDKCWPHIVSAGMPYVNLGSQQATAAKCATKIWKALALDPSQYDDSLVSSENPLGLKE